MPTETIAQPTAHAEVPARVETTTDATRGEPIASRGRTRKAELEQAHDLLPTTELRARADVEMTFAQVNQ
jgi:hypothetical protein